MGYGSHTTDPVRVLYLQYLQSGEERLGRTVELRLEGVSLEGEGYSNQRIATGPAPPSKCRPPLDTRRRNRPIPAASLPYTWMGYGIRYRLPRDLRVSWAGDDIARLENGSFRLHLLERGRSLESCKLDYLTSFFLGGAFACIIDFSSARVDLAETKGGLRVPDPSWYLWFPDRSCRCQCQFRPKREAAGAAETGYGTHRVR